MKIMTFNALHCENYRTGAIDLELFGKYIASFDADICSLNEIRGKGALCGYTDQTARLAEITSAHGRFAQAFAVDGTSPYGNAVLSKNAPVLFETVAVPEPEILGKRYEPRCVAKAVYRVEGGELLLLNVHMGLSVHERESAVRTVCEIIDGASMPVILTGDFNAEPDGAELAPLFDRLKSALPSREAEKGTFPSDSPRMTIDYIMYRSLECRGAYIADNSPSDHLPVVAFFDYLKNST